MIKRKKRCGDCKIYTTLLWTAMLVGGMPIKFTLKHNDKEGMAEDGYTYWFNPGICDNCMKLRREWI